MNLIKIHSLRNSFSEIILLFTPRVVITNFPLNLRETPLVVIYMTSNFRAFDGHLCAQHTEIKSGNSALLFRAKLWINLLRAGLFVT